MNLQEKCVAIIGTGQIGCSIALGLQGKVGLIAGVDPCKANITQAIQNRMIDVELDLRSAIDFANILVVATPVDVAIPIITEILDFADERTVVLDVGSTKAPVCKAIRNHVNRKIFVATHPMAGSPVTGPDGANSKLFANCKTFICQPGLSSKFALDTVVKLYNDLQSKVEYIEPAEHDRLVGLVSHLPHILSYSMCNVVKSASSNNPEWENIAASGFDSTSRLAKSPASMWMPILNQNKDNLLKYINLMIDELHKLEQHIDTEDTSALVDFIESAVDIREQFEGSRTR